MYQKNTQNGYIVGIVSGVSEGNITADEYTTIKTAIDNRPQPPDGYGYRLREDLTWELFELPAVENDENNME